MSIRAIDSAGLDLDKVEEALARDMTFPARWYSDPEIYAFELEHVFKKSWQYAGPVQLLAEHGDCIVCHAGTVPIVVTRDADGGLRGFVNVCRHRAFPVVTENCNRKLLQCRYHAWTYNLDGSLHKAPRSERETEFDPADFCLLPVAVEAWNECVFVNPDPDAAPLLEAYPEFEPLALERGLDFSGYKYHGRNTYEIPANWKVWVENASECYHCPTVHTHSFSDAFVDDADVYEYVDGERILGQFTVYNERAKRYPGKPRDESVQFRYTYLWPVTTLVQDDYVAFPGTIVPTGPESCVFVADMFTHPDYDQQTLDERLQMWNATLEEDQEVVLLQQPGLRSQMVPNGRLMPASESAISRFHRMVFDAFSNAQNGD
jgi:phenylpropionate dioxygenase-like ring-hydroxylating dioxygenase large terminal subunit